MVKFREFQKWLLSLSLIRSISLEMLGVIHHLGVLKNIRNYNWILFLAELDEAGNQAKTYTLGNEYAGHVSELNNSLTSENKAASYYITDEQGSIRYILDQSGEVQNYYQYSAFGETIISEETTPNRLRYNAQTEDELTGLYYLRARYYAPGIGRFTQEDVIYNDGLNLYAFH